MVEAGAALGDGPLRRIHFVSLFAGSWPEGLALLGGLKLGPPSAYMGSKKQLLTPLFEAWGLAPGQGALSILLCDAGPWGWVWRALTVPRIARAVARILRSWRTEDPTALWKRLAAADPPPDLVHLAATVLWLQARAAGNVPIRYSRRRKCWLMDSNARAARREGRTVWKPLVQRGKWARSRSAGIQRTTTVARRVEAIADGIARFLALQDGNSFTKPVYVRGGAWHTDGYAHLSDSARKRGFRERLRPEVLAERVERLTRTPWPPVRVVHGDVDGAMAILRARGDLSEHLVYMDPPYVDCTAYAADCSRARVVSIAVELAERGALVCVSESVPIPELVALGWYTEDLTDCRAGQSWSGRKRKGEWITMSRPLAARPSSQLSLAL